MANDSTLLQDLQRAAANLPISHQLANAGAVVAALIEHLDHNEALKHLAKDAETAARWLEERYPPTGPPVAVPTDQHQVAARVTALESELEALRNPPAAPESQSPSPAAPQATVTPASSDPTVVSEPEGAGPHEQPEPPGSPENPTYAELQQQLQSAQIALANQQRATVTTEPAPDAPEPDAPSPDSEP